MRTSDAENLLFRLGERDIQAFLTPPRAFEQILQRQGGFADPWTAQQDIEAIFRQAAPQDFVQPGNARRRLPIEERVFGHCPYVFRHLHPCQSNQGRIILAVESEIFWPPAMKRTGGYSSSLASATLRGRKLSPPQS